MGVLDVFRKLGGLIRRAVEFAKARGFSDELVMLALDYVKRAGNMPGLATNAERKAWVYAALAAATGRPESVINLAIETAIQLWKAGHPSTQGA